MKRWSNLPILALLLMTGVSASAQSIEGKSWRVVELAGQKLSAADSAKTSLTFDGNAKRMAASVGCNRIGGPYENEGKRLTFGALVSTRMACPGELDQRERAFLSALSKAAGFQQIGSVFVIVDADRKKLMQLTAN